MSQILGEQENGRLPAGEKYILDTFQVKLRSWAVNQLESLL